LGRVLWLLRLRGAPVLRLLGGRCPADIAGLVAAIIVWIIVTFRLKSLYVKTLISAIEKRQIDFEGLNLDAQDPAMIAVIEKTLRVTEAEEEVGLDLSEHAETAYAS